MGFLMVKFLKVLCVHHQLKVLIQDRPQAPTQSKEVCLSCLHNPWALVHMCSLSMVCHPSR